MNKKYNYATLIFSVNNSRSKLDYMFTHSLMLDAYILNVTRSHFLLRRGQKKKREGSMREKKKKRRKKRKTTKRVENDR